MGPIAFITGASSGFGKACAERFAKEKYALILLARRGDRLTSLKKELEKSYNTEVLLLEADVRNRKAVEEAVAGLGPDWKNIDVLINNAGLAAGFSTIDEGDPADWDTMIDTNVKGLLYVSRAVLPLMRERRMGHVINIGSTAAKDVYPKGNVYCATKHAVDALSKAMRIDMLPFRIRVTAVHPGAAETEFSSVRFKGDAAKAKEVYKGYIPLSAADVAEAVYFCASRPEHVCINDLVITPVSQANAHYFQKE
jgi:3-hydroxy acid dehydrogenase/malonic semialdehyde reductase